MKIRGHGSLACGNHFCYACRDREPRFLKHTQKPPKTPSFGALERFLVAQGLEWVLSSMEHQLVFVPIAVTVCHGGPARCDRGLGLDCLGLGGAW